MSENRRSGNSERQAWAYWRSERNTNTNLRYKTGRNLSYKENDVFQIKNPEDAFLPKTGISSEFVFVKGHLAQLERAISNFMLDTHINKNDI